MQRTKKKSRKCIEVASKQACVRASLKTAFTARNAMVFVCQKGLPNHFKSLMYTNTQRRNPYNEHDSSRKTGFRLRRCSLCPSCPFWNFCRAARSQRLSYRRHLTKTRSNPESRLFRVRYESDICPAIDAHPRFRKNQLPISSCQLSLPKNQNYRTFDCHLGYLTRTSATASLKLINA